MKLNLVVTYILYLSSKGMSLMKVDCSVERFLIVKRSASHCKSSRCCADTRRRTTLRLFVTAWMLIWSCQSQSGINSKEKQLAFDCHWRKIVDRDKKCKSLSLQLLSRILSHNVGPFTIFIYISAHFVFVMRDLCILRNRCW